MNEKFARFYGAFEDPVVARRLAVAGAWCGVAAIALMPELAWAAFPIPGVQRMVTDVQDHTTQEGSIIGATLGLAGGAVRMMLSNFEMGVGHVVRTGAGGAVIGSSPEVATYVTG